MFDWVTDANAQEQPPTQGPAEAQVGREVQESVGHTGAPRESGHGAFPPFDPATYGSQLLWLAITFGFLYWLMSRVMLPRIGAILETRSNRIGVDLGDAARLKGETDAAIAAYEQSLAEARSRAQAIAANARDESKSALDAERGHLEGDLNGRLEAAEARIGAVKAQALAEVDAIARDTAAVLVETLLGAGASQSEVAAAVDAALAERS